MTVIVDGKETVLGPMDSCTIAPNEVREIVNREQRRLQDAGRHPLSAGSEAMTDAPTDPLALFAVKRQGRDRHRRLGRVRRGRRGDAGFRRRETRADRRQGEGTRRSRRANAARRGAEVEEIVGRPTSEAACDRRSSKRGRPLRPGRHSRRRVGQERRLEDRRHVARALPRRDGRECHAESG